MSHAGEGALIGLAIGLAYILFAVWLSGVMVRRGEGRSAGFVNYDAPPRYANADIERMFPLDEAAISAVWSSSINWTDCEVTTVDDLDKLMNARKCLHCTTTTTIGENCRNCGAPT